MHYKLFATIAFCFFCFILWVIYLANTDSPSVFFDFIYAIPYGDKLGHIGLFGFLTFTTIIGSKFRTVSCAGRNYYFGALIVIGFVIIEEISQAFIPSRTFDMGDLTADAVGISLAIGLAFLIHQYISKHR